MKRFDDLVALVRDKDDFFKAYTTPAVGSLEYKHLSAYNDAFVMLDHESWEILKLKAIQHYQDERRPGQRKESFFNHLNEAFAYKFLLETGFNEVRFMTEGKKGPDIRYTDRGTKYCEVKTIGMSDVEIHRRDSREVYDGMVHSCLSKGFMDVLQKAVNAARYQINFIGGVGFAFIIVRFDDFTEEFIETYRAQLTDFCTVERGVVIKNGHRGNIITRSPELFT
jgi:hypothetical protein